MRAFFALPIAVELEEALVQQRYRLEAELFASPLKWIPENNYHITLAFLGDIESRDVPRLDSLAQTVAARHGPFMMRVSELSWFPSAHKPRILAALIEDNQLMNQLQSDLLRQLREQGFPVERRKFRPHITLARAARDNMAAPFNGMERAVESEVDELVLFESHLRPEGSVYEPLSALLLGE